MTIEDIAHELSAQLKHSDADYIEARLEDNQTSHLTYRGKNLESVGRSTAGGGNVRALVSGGWGFTSFNNLEKPAGRVAQAMEQAQFVGSGESGLAPVEPVVDKIAGDAAKNPVSIPLAEKKKLLDEYRDIIWSTPQIQTATIGYTDSHRRVIFLNSSGSHIEQERTDINLRLAAVAARDGEVQQVGLSVGSRGDFSAMQHLHEQVAQAWAVAAISAPCSTSTSR